MSEENKDKNSYDEESRMRRKRLRRKTTISYFAGLAAVFVGLFVLMLLAITVYSWIDSKTEETDDMLQATMGGAQVAEGVMYTQADVDLKVAEAVALAQAEIDSAVSIGQEELLEEIKDQLTESQSVLETLRPLYPDDVVLISGGKYHFIPIREDLAQHSYIQENLQVLENGRFQYVENDQVVSSASESLIKFSNDIVLFPPSIRFIESSDRSARSASSACVKFLCFRYNLTLSAIIYLISFILLFSILIYF